MNEPTTPGKIPEEDLSPYWGVTTPDRGLCLIHGFLDGPPANVFALQRLCDFTMVMNPECRRLYTFELPSCKLCRAILLNMKQNGQR